MVDNPHILRSPNDTLCECAPCLCVGTPGRGLYQQAVALYGALDDSISPARFALTLTFVLRSVYGESNADLPFQPCLDFAIVAKV